MNFNLVRLMVLIFLFLSLLTLTYIFYRSEIVYQGSNSHYYFKYYLFSITAVFFWTIALFFKQKTKKNLLVFTISLLFSFYILEFILNFIFYTNVYTVKMRIFNNNFDTRKPIEFVEDKINEGIDIVPILRNERFVSKKMGEEIFVLSPGLSNKFTVLCNETGDYITYKSDRYGFNNPDKVWDNNSTDVLIIGDSYVHGHCVPSKNNIAGRIRKMTGKSVINLGVESSGALKQLGILKEYGVSRKPKNLFWMYYEGNDIEDFEVELKNKILVKYLKKNFSQNLVNYQEEIDNYKNEKLNYILNGRKTLHYKTRFFRLYELRTFIYKFFQSLHYKKEIIKNPIIINPLLINTISEAKKLTESWGGEFFFVYIPEVSRYSTKVKDHESYYRKAEIIKLIENKNIVVIDLDKELLEKNFNDNLMMIKMYVCNTCHLTNDGNKKIAEVILEKLDKN